MAEIVSDVLTFAHLSMKHLLTLDGVKAKHILSTMLFVTHCVPAPVEVPCEYAH
jgi:hypothetical protein